MLAAVLAPLIALAAPSGRCPTTAARVVSDAHPAVPDNVRATHAHVQVAFDIGSDGRVRRAVIAESSGNAAFDRAIVAGAQDERFDAPSVSCAAFSTSFIENLTVPPEMMATPAPLGTPVPAPVCGAPFVTPAGLSPARREPPGTAAVDVVLDAAAHVDAVRIAGSSGNAATDNAALAAARASGYQFVTFAGCPATATTYRLELTFR